MNTMNPPRTRIDLLPTIVIIAAVVAIATLGGLATDTQSAWYVALRKPEWQPPAWLFGPVWTTLYVLIIISATIAWHRTSGDVRRSVMIPYAINGAANLAWSFLFFQLQSPLVAGIDILVVLLTIVWTMLRVWPHSRLAALLLVPYLLWVGFASVLNWTIVGLN